MIAYTNTNQIINILSMDFNILITILLTLAVTIIIYSVRNYFNKRNTNNNRNNVGAHTNRSCPINHNEHSDDDDNSDNKNTNNQRHKPLPTTKQQQLQRNIIPEIPNQINWNPVNQTSYRSASSSSSNDFSSMSGHSSSDLFQPVNIFSNSASVKTITITEESETNITIGDSAPITIKNTTTKHIDIPLDLAWSPLSTSHIRSFYSICCVIAQICARIEIFHSFRSGPKVPYGEQYKYG